MTNMGKEKNITDKFKKYFTLRVADCSKDYKAIFKLRYDVFCKEFQFEKENYRHQEQEVDKFDSLGPQCIIYHTTTGEPAGCIRLLLSSTIKNNVLPFQDYCNLTQCESYCEFSRLTVSKKFRRRCNDLEVPMTPEQSINIQAPLCSMHRHFPIVPIALMFSSLNLARNLSIESGFAMIEPKLAQTMEMYGIHFQQIGEIVHYHGKRAAYEIDPSTVKETLRPELLDFFNYINDIVAQSTFKYTHKRYNKKIL